VVGDREWIETEAVKHRRSISLVAPFKPKDYYEHDPAQYHTLRQLQQWEIVGCKCGVCGHIGWVDKEAVLRVFGDMYLMNLRYRMLCACGNKDGNKVLIGRLAR
jgi:hypothetical protein